MKATKAGKLSHQYHNLKLVLANAFLSIVKHLTTQMQATPKAGLLSKGVLFQRRFYGQAGGVGQVGKIFRQGLGSHQCFVWLFVCGAPDLVALGSAARVGGRGK